MFDILTLQWDLPKHSGATGPLRTVRYFWCGTKWKRVCRCGCMCVFVCVSGVQWAHSALTPPAVQTTVSRRWLCGFLFSLPARLHRCAELTAQKYRPSSAGSRLRTVSAPLSASALVAENFSWLKLPKSCLLLPVVVKTTSSIAFPGSCLNQYIWKYKGPFLWLQSIVASPLLFCHKTAGWVTSLPPAKPVRMIRAVLHVNKYMTLVKPFKLNVTWSPQERRQEWQEKLFSEELIHLFTKSISLSGRNIKTYRKEEVQIFSRKLIQRMENVAAEIRPCSCTSCRICQKIT